MLSSPTPHIQSFLKNTADLPKAELQQRSCQITEFDLGLFVSQHISQHSAEEKRPAVSKTKPSGISYSLRDADSQKYPLEQTSSAITCCLFRICLSQSTGGNSIAVYFPIETTWWKKNNDAKSDYVLLTG